MKTNELMIGDVVRFRSDQWSTEEDARPFKVTGIGEPNYPEYMPYILIAELSNEKNHIDLFEPIPLTAEILHKNGFKLTEISDEYYDEFEPRLFWEYSTDTKESLNINIKIDENVNTSIDVHNGDGVQMLQYFTDRNILYIHELQHALRLVGLTEMADNLKV